ncbi:hypothetical protein [Streptomyces sp. NPDC004284]|uniref:hypothetical protein n=1 Tax=Streptomyces sp. NPDC004284 TaxID=3364695 RepID=UPI0036BDF958
MEARQVAEYSGSLRVLLNEWDPIGAADSVQDEYDCLIEPLLGRLHRGAGRAEISAFLWHEVTGHFGLSPFRREVDAVADRLVAWWSALDSPTLISLVNHQEINVVVTAVAAVGSQVDAAGVTGFIDQVKHPSWWSADVSPPQLGDRLQAVVLDDSRNPPRLSALRSDIEIARALRERE